MILRPHRPTKVVESLISRFLLNSRSKASPTPWMPPQTTKVRSEEHTSELQSRSDLVCRLLLEKKKRTTMQQTTGCSLMRVFTDIERESLGVICPRVLAMGTSYTSALTDGRRATFSIAVSRCWRATPTTNT